MRDIAINTYGYIFTTPAADAVRRLVDLGYTSFELMIHPPHLPLDGLDNAARRDLRRAIESTGAKITSMNMPSLDQNLASAYPRVRATSIAMFKDAIDLAADLGTPWLVSVPGRMSPLFPPAVADRTAWATETISAIAPHAEARGIGLAIENVPISAFPDAASLVAFVRGFGSKALGICYDAANAHYIGENVTEGLRLVGDLLKVAHVSDTTRKVWKHDPIGMGDVPVAEFARALDAIGFAGPITFEIIGHDPEAAILASHRAVDGLGFQPVKKGLPL